MADANITTNEAASASRQSSSHTNDTVAIDGFASQPKSRDFHCEKCDISFTEKRALLRHQRESEKHLSQTGASNTSRTHQCPECGKSYKRAHDLRRHLDEVHRAKRRRRNAGDDAASDAPDAEDQTYTVPVMDAAGPPPLDTIEEPYEVVQQTPLQPVPLPGATLLFDAALSGLVDPVAFVDGTEENSEPWPSSSAEPQNSLAILRRYYDSHKQDQRSPGRNSSLNLANQLLAHNTRFSKDHQIINLAPETREWLSAQLSSQTEFSVAAFNERDFGFTSDRFKVIHETLAPDLKFSHHKLPFPFDHKTMIMAYNHMATTNPNWNIKVLGASPIINLRDKTATVFIQSLVTDDGVVWAEQILEYKFRLYSSRWLAYLVTSMRGQRMLDGTLR